MNAIAARRLLALTAAAAALACKSDSTAPADEILPDGPPVTIGLYFTLAAGSTVSATLNAVTYHDDDMFVRVPSGTREITGTFTGKGVTITFGGFTDGGGVILNSVRNLSGPNAVVDKCGVTYSNSAGGTSSFSLRFNVETAFGHHC